MLKNLLVLLTKLQTSSKRSGLDCSSIHWY